MKKNFSVALVSVLLVASLFILPGAAGAGVGVVMPADPVPEVSQEEIDKQRELAAQYNEEESRIREQYLDSEENVQYYAYLNISTVEEEMRPIILVARNMIIHRYSWVADGMNGKVLDKEGNLKREIPEFSELFPEDWEMPVSLAKDVDLSYYAAPNK